MKNLISSPGPEANWLSGGRRLTPASVAQSPQIAETTRRQFLVHCSVLAAAVAVTPPAFGVPIRGRLVPLEQIGPGDFARQRNTAFLVRPERMAAVEIVLLEIQPLGSPTAAPSAEDADNEKFTLLFRGPRGVPLGQDTYAFEHPRIGIFEMFIVPIGCLDESHCYYEAIFNRPVRGTKARNVRGRTR